MERLHEHPRARGGRVEEIPGDQHMRRARRAGGAREPRDRAVACLGKMRTDLLGHGGEAPAQVKVGGVDEAEVGHDVPFAQVIAHLIGDRNANRVEFRRGF